MPYWPANWRTFSREVAGSSVERPTNSTPRSLNSRLISTRRGISTRQGPHHVAQKLTTWTRAPESPRRKVPPSRAWRFESRTGLGGRLLAPPEKATRATARTAATAVGATATRGRDQNDFERRASGA